MLPDIDTTLIIPDFNASVGDRATLGSDPRTAEGRDTEKARRGGQRHQPMSGNISWLPNPTSPGAAGFDKPNPVDDILPLLDTIETSLQSTRGRYFPKLARLRDDVVEQLVTLLAPEEYERLERIAACGNDMIVGRSGGKLKLSPALCRDRMCPICSYYRSLKLKRKLKDTIGRMRRPKLLTLTLKQSSDKLETQARRLTSCFAKLRRRSAFVAACKSGFWVLEYTFRENSRTWHVHIHAVIDAYFISHEMLSQMWLKITGDSFVVDIRQANERHAGYLAKYVAKNGMFLPPRDQMLEYLRSVKSIRMFGSWGGLKITEDSVLDLGDFHRVGYLSDIIKGAKNGWYADIMIVRELIDTAELVIPPGGPPA